MEIKRTANAGILLTLDGVTILLDGVANTFYSYLGTPDELRQELVENIPDVVAFTHEHQDHYDSDFKSLYQEKTQKSVLCPGDCIYQTEVNSVNIQKVTTRHLGKTQVPHVSFIITGSKTLWFMGDATPVELKKMAEMPSPDVLVVPFAYAITSSAWRESKKTGAKKIIILHLPKAEDDTNNLFGTIRNVTGEDDSVVIPKLGEKITV